jgi:hypothetical protein
MTDQPVATPFESVLGSGAGGPLTAPTPWVSTGGGVYFGGAALLGSASGGLQTPGSLNCQGLYINGVAINTSNFLPVTGGTMGGPLILSADPTANLQASTKQYVDSNVTTINTSLNNYLLKAGGTITGNLTINGSTTLSADPTLALQAATKQYVDGKFSGVIGIPDATADGSTYGRNNNAWSNVIDAGTY